MDLIKIGIIDDDWQAKPISIKIANRALERQDENVKLFLIELKENIDEMISDIIFEKFDGLLIDQKLNSKISYVSYTGTDISEKINKIKYIPYSFWTSNPEGVVDICQSSEVDSVYNHESTEDNESLTKTDMFKRLLLKARKYKKEIETKEKRLNFLLKIENPSLEELTEIDSLDEDIERSVTKVSPLSKKERELRIETINKTIDDFFKKFGNDE